MAEPPRFTAREFKTVAIQAVAAASAAIRKIRVDDEVFRKLKRQMVATVETREHLLEALTVLMRQIAERTTTRNVRFSQVADLIPGPDRAPDAPMAEGGPEDGEAELVLDDNLQADPTWQVRTILDRFRGADGRIIYLVDWQPTEEPARNIPPHLIAAFDRQRRALVRRTYIEDQAQEA